MSLLRLAYLRPSCVDGQRSHHANVRVHQRPGTFRSHDQDFARGLPFIKLLLCLGSFMM
jgi:hypothetical protein